MFDADAGDTDSDDGPRYTDLELSDGTVVVYDRENPDAWVESDCAIDFAALRAHRGE
jgi:hypothetical protein